MSERLSFKPFDEHGGVRIYDNGFLPHWRQVGCTYFVTFRLADSVPQRVLDEWKYERKQWLAARGVDPTASGWPSTIRSLSQQDLRLFQRRFANKLFACLDTGHGECFLRNAEIAQIAADALLFFHTRKLETGDFVVMPNHVHALMTPIAGFELEDVLHSIKSYTANQINKRLGRSGPLWMNESYDHLVRDGEELLRIQTYIRTNPDKARLDAGKYQLHTAEYELNL